MGEKQSRRRTKRKASIRSKYPKEPGGVRKPPRFRQANSSALAQAFAQRPPGFAVYGFHARKQVKQQACQLLFCNFFLFGKEKSGTFSFLQKAFSKSFVCSQRKSGTFSFYKRLFLKALSVRKEKSGTFSFLQKAFSKSVVCSQRKSGTFSFYKRKELGPVGRHRKEPPQIPSAGICVNLTSGCHLFSKISNAFFRVFP